MKVTRKFTQPTGRRSSTILVDSFQGLDTTAPYTMLKDGVSPYMINTRLYARNSTDRRIAIGTRKGPGYLSDPAGEALDQSITSTTGADDEAVTDTAWAAEKFTAGVTGRLTKVEVNVNSGDAAQHLIVKLYTDSGGSPGTLLGTSSVLLTDASASYAYEVARFINAPEVSSGTDYWIVCHRQMGGSGSWNWSSTTASTTGKTSTNSGGTWSASSESYNFKAYVSTDSATLGSFEFRPSSGTNTKLIAHGTDVYKIDDGTGALTSIKSGLSAQATEYSFGQADDKVFYSNGYDVIQKWDGTTNSATTISTVATLLIFHKNRLFYVKASEPTRLEFSELGDYEDIGATNFIYVPTSKSGDDITGLHVFQDNLIIFTRKTKYVLFGEDPGNFVLRQSSGKKGSVNQWSIASDPNYVYYLSDDGIYRYNGSSDQLMSDSIQNEVDKINDKEKAHGVVHNNYYRLYYPSQTSAVNDGAFIWDSINSFWLLDTGSYIKHPFVTEEDVLVECSSVVGAAYNAEQQFSDLGAPLDFKYWSKYFGDGLRKIFMRRLTPAVRLQTIDYDIDLLIDIDRRNTVPLQYTIDAQASGETWGGGEDWGGGAVWGTAQVSTPKSYQGTEAFWHQIRFEQEGVDTPVEILSYQIEIRARRVR